MSEEGTKGPKQDSHNITAGETKWPKHDSHNRLRLLLPSDIGLCFNKLNELETLNLKHIYISCKSYHCRITTECMILPGTNTQPAEISM